MHSPMTAGVSAYLICHALSYSLGFSGSRRSLRASSMGPISVPTPGTVLCGYCHLNCNDIPKTAKDDWGCCQPILPKTLTPWAHASTWGLNHASNSFCGPRYTTYVSTRTNKVQHTPLLRKLSFRRLLLPRCVRDEEGLSRPGKTSLVRNSIKAVD